MSQKVRTRRIFDPLTFFVDLVLIAAMGDFWRNRNQWLPTWPQNVNDRAMVVYVSNHFRIIYGAHGRTATT